MTWSGTIFNFPEMWDLQRDIMWIHLLAF